MTSHSLDEINPLLEAACLAQQFAGAAWSVERYGEVASAGEVGDQGGIGDRAVGADTLFDTASLTKPVATAASALSLMERGMLRDDASIGRFYPVPDSWREITVRRLLTHTSGLPAYLPLHETCRGSESIRAGILDASLQAPPGTKYQYSCLGYILLQGIIEQISGLSLDRLAAETVFGPLGMTDTLFRPPADLLPRVASGGFCPHLGGLALGEPHDPLARAAGGVSGNAGVFSTARDVARFGSAVLSCAAGQVNGFLRPETARLMIENQVDPEIGGHSFGFFTHPNLMLPRGDILPLTSVGHTGFTGTSLVLSPDEGLSVALLTNCLHFRQDKTAFFRTRRQFHNLVGVWAGSSAVRHKRSSRAKSVHESGPRCNIYEI